MEAMMKHFSNPKVKENMETILFSVFIGLICFFVLANISAVVINLTLVGD
jgi:hypothetical protein